MIQLVQHLLKVNQKEIIQKSLLNCHVIGLHSIMLLDCPEKTIRMYITSQDHELYKNYNSADSLSYHPHHCEITLHCIFGSLDNIIMKVENEPSGNDSHLVDRYLYSSKITSGEMGFVKDGEDYLKEYSRTSLMAGDSVHMPASQIHTVACSQHTVNGWFVYEGKENKNYKPYAWSNSDLTTATSDGLYIKPTFTDIVNLLKSVQLL